MEVPGGETRKRGRSSGAPPSPRPAPMNTEEEEDESINFSSATLQSRCTRSTPHDYLVQLNVSGRVFTTLASTLRAYPSKLQEWLDDGFRSLPRDPEGLPFIDRDSRNFHHLLHYLQGYGVPSKVEELVLLSDDAVYYGVEQLRRDLCVDTPTWRFNPGPGVSKDGIHFSTSSIVGLCGDVPLGLQLNHVIVFRVDKCELISVGVVAVENVKEDTALHEQRQSVSYRNTGELVQYWTDTPIFLSGTRYQQQDAISIKVQFVPAGSRPDVGAATTAGTSSAQGDGASGLEEDASIQRRAASTTSEVSPSSLPSAPKEAAAVASSGSTQFSASEMDAIITFNREDKVEFEVRWPAPVPPLQFAASLQGISLITILGAASMDEVHSPAIPTFSPDSLSVDGVPVTEATAMPRQPPVALARGASLFFNAPPDG